MPFPRIVDGFPLCGHLNKPLACGMLTVESLRPRKRRGLFFRRGVHLWKKGVSKPLSSSTQNELDLEDAKMLVANGVTSVTEGANMPTTLEATKYFQENGVLFVGGKAANAGGVATSALEMSQNSERLHWTFEEVDGKLKGIMETIYANISDAAKRYNATVGGQTDYVAGANIAGFEKVVDAMIAQGVC